MQTDKKTLLTIQNFVSNVLLHMNISLSAYEDFSKNLRYVLQTIGEFCEHDRIQIIEINHDMTYTIQYEWCSKQLSPLSEQLKHDVLFYDDRLGQQLCSQNYIIVRSNDVQANPLLQSLLQAENCQQMLVLPLFESGAQFAFITFMQCNAIHDWSPEEIKMLQDFSSVIATQLNNYHLIRHLLHHVKKYQKKQQAAEILCSQLKELHEELQPAWNEIKKLSGLPENTVPEFMKLEQHINTLDKLCHPLTEK